MGDEIKHIHWVIQAYDKESEKHELINFSEVTILVAKNEEEAIERAKELIKRPLYRLSKVCECTQCNKIDLQMEMQMTQLEMMRRFIK